MLKGLAALRGKTGAEQGRQLLSWGDNGLLLRLESHLSAQMPDGVELLLDGGAIHIIHPHWEVVVTRQKAMAVLTSHSRYATMQGKSLDEVSALVKQYAESQAVCVRIVDAVMEVLRDWPDYKQE